VIKEGDYDSVVSLLHLVTKYYTRRDHYDEYLYNSLRSMPIWKETSVWEEIMKNMIEKKTTEEISKKKAAIAAAEKKDNQIVNKLFSFGVKKISNLLDIGQPKINDREIVQHVLQDLAFYTGRLTKNLVVSSDIITHLSKE
jgi:hypothetical protein